MESDYRILKAREKELSNQLQDVQDRRNSLVEQAQETNGTNREAIQARVNVLDQRLSQIEADLTTVGHQLAQTAPISIAAPPPEIIRQGYNDDDMVAAGLSGAGIMLALLIPFLIRSFRRRRYVPPSAPQPMMGSERIDRMEQSIDAIAVEIERVSENQRFMTRLMTETQLAGTIAAVRGAADAARLAAEGSSDVR